MPGIGKVTEPELRSLGISRIGDLQEFGLEGLKKRFGKYGAWLFIKSRGEDTGAYGYEEEPKSISHETTFETDTSDLDELERKLSYLAQLVARRLRDHGLFARTVGLKLRYSDFHTITRDLTLDEPTHIDWVIFENVLSLFANAWNSRLKVRLLGVRASNLEKSTFQLNLLQSPKREKLDRVLAAADRVRDRFGFDAVKLARSLDPKT
jgi:DNA polymerase-4